MGIIIYLFDEAKADLQKFESKSNLFFNIRFNIIAGIIVGLALGSIDIFLNKLSNKKRSFRFHIIIKSILYIFVFVIVLSLVIFRAAAIFYETILQLPFGQEEAGSFHQIVLALIIYSILVSILISFISEVNKKFGPGVLIRLLLGKYYKPRVEERIFMFLDLKSSTTIAEKLGHIKYSQLIQDCFNDLNISASKLKAEIYQYVGDEAVLTWTLDKGLKNTNYLKFYFDFQNRIINRSEYYKNNYDLVPEFKAGVNGGIITAAEVGEIKREIAYHGDVINTAARIQGVCNTYNQKLLVSEFLAEKLNTASDYISKEIGSISLKGKKFPVNVFSVELQS